MDIHRTTTPISSKTPPNRQVILPPTPPGTVERGPSSTIASVHALQQYWANCAPRSRREAVEIIEVETSKAFNPHDHLDELEPTLPRFDRYLSSIRFRMPSLLHEIMIAELESDFTEQKYRLGGKYSDVKLSRSARVIIDEGNESRQPDMQFRHKARPRPNMVLEVAQTQLEKELKALADDYIVKTDGEIKTVYGIKLNPPGKPSTVTKWCAKITPSKDPEYDVEVRVETIFRKV